MISTLLAGVDSAACSRSANSRGSPSAVPTNTENSNRETCSAARIAWSRDTRWDAVNSPAMSISP